MAKVQTEFIDSTRPNNKGFINLQADQSFNPYSWKPPINWSGTVNGMQVNFVQIDSSGYDRNCYDFSNFPKEIEYTIDYIVKAIDDGMRVMD
jgi:hypothetical protein